MAVTTIVIILLLFVFDFISFRFDNFPQRGQGLEGVPGCLGNDIGFSRETAMLVWSRQLTRQLGESEPRAASLCPGVRPEDVGGGGGGLAATQVGCHSPHVPIFAKNSL